ncbi:MAG: GAF domain-containing protein [Flammeovirgaceae bacterium]
MKNIQFNIGQKVLLVNILLILIFTGSTVFSLISLQKEKEGIQYSFEIVDPSVDALEEFILVVTRSRMLITNWIYLPNNEDDRNALRHLKDFDFPALKDKITSLDSYWKNASLVASIDSIIFQFDDVLTYEREIMQKLSSTSYFDPVDKAAAEKTLKEIIIPQSIDLVLKLEEILKTEQRERILAERKLLSSIETFRISILLLGVLLVLLGVVLTILSYRNITEPIKYMNQIAWELSRGRIPEISTKYETRSQDEIGEMSRAIRKLVKGLDNTTRFAQAIGKGDYLMDFTPLSDEDVLGNELINMRDNLLSVSEEAEQRNWTMTGLSKFSDMLRDNHDNLQLLYDNLLAGLIKYLKANQGGIFLIDDIGTESEPFMQLESCYAWDRFKGLNKKVYLGEGLAGQAWLEESTIYATDFPDHYVEITSGLGQQNPTSILIVPIKFNEMMFGVIEIASLYHFPSYQIEFIEHVAESFASTLSSVRVNLKTMRLLNESQQLTEQLRMQEEETRISMEELQATQEEMRRKQDELIELKNNLEHEVERQTKILRNQGEELRVQNIQLLASQEQMQITQHSLMRSERKLRAILNGAAEGIMTTNGKGMIEMINDATVNMSGYKAHKLKGSYIDKILPSITLDKLRGQGRMTVNLHKRDGSIEEIELVYNTVKYEGDLHALFFLRSEKYMQPMYEENQSV